MSPSLSGKTSHSVGHIPVAQRMSHSDGGDTLSSPWWPISFLFFFAIALSAVTCSESLQAPFCNNLRSSSKWSLHLQRGLLLIRQPGLIASWTLVYDFPHFPRLAVWNPSAPPTSTQTGPRFLFLIPTIKTKIKCPIGHPCNCCHYFHKWIHENGKRFLRRYFPFGIVFLVAGKILEMDDPSAMGKKLGFYAITVVMGLVLHGLFILPAMYFFITKKSPIVYIRGILQALLISLATSSR